MKLTYLLFFMLTCTMALCQRVILSPDSSALIYPNKVSLAIEPQERGRYFVLSAASLKTLLIQSNYLYDQLDVISERLELSYNALRVRDSINHLLANGKSVSEQRATLYSDAYATSRRITESQDKHFRTLLADVSQVQNINRKTKRRSFARGLATGLAAGIVAATFFLSTTR